MNAIETSQSDDQGFVIWDQWEGEPLTDHKLFNVYLALGLGRTIDDAAIAYHESLSDTAAETRTLTSVKNDFFKLALRWKWQERADRYDIAFMKGEMKKSYFNVAQAVVKMSAKVLAAADNDEIQPTTFKEMMDAIHGLISLLPPPSEDQVDVRVSQRQTKRISRSL